MTLFKAILALCLGAGLCKADLGDQWRFTAHLQGSGQGLLALASDGTKTRLIDSSTLYSSDQSGRSLRAIASLGDLRDIYYADGLWVIVGTVGQIWTSTDGNEWQKRISSTIYTLSEVAGGNDGWIALIEGRAQYLHSPDGLLWTIREFNSSFYPHRIAWAEGLWIATNFSQNRTSVDGINWTPASPPGAASLCWTGNRWLAVESQTVKTSTNGMDWSATSGSVIFGTTVIGHNDQAVVLGTSGVTYRLEEAGWVSIPPIQNVELLDAIWTGSHYVAVGYGSLVISSVDGVSWEIQNSKTQHHFSGVAAGPNGFVAVTSGSSAFFSRDGVNWAQIPAILSVLLEDVTWHNDLWIIVGGEHIWSSADGFNWSHGYPPGNTSLRSVAGNGQSAVAVGDNGAILLWDANSDWIKVLSPVTARLSCVTAGGGWFVAGGTGGVVARSNDGVNWTSANSGINMNDIAWTGSEFVGVGTGGTIVRSSDGELWSPVTNPGQENFNAVLASEGSIMAFAYSDSWRRSPEGAWKRLPHGGTAAAAARGLSVVMGNQGFISTSTDQSNWTTRHGSASGSPIAKGPTRIVGCSSSGSVTTSETGDVWITRPTGTDVQLEDVCWGAEGFMAVGRYGTICRSNDGIAWTVSTLPGNPWLLKVKPFRDGYLTVSNTGRTDVYSPANGWVTGQLTSPNGSSAPRSIATGPESVVCVTFSNYLLSSENGLNWTYRTSAEANVLWDGVRYIASSTSGVRTSDDGVSWTLRDQTSYPRGYWNGGFNGLYFVSTSAMNLAVGNPVSGWRASAATTFGYDPSIISLGSKLVASFPGGTAVSGGTIPMPFSEWASISGISPDPAGFNGDINDDGVANGLAYLMNAENGFSAIPTPSPIRQSVHGSTGQMIWEIRRPWPSPEDIVQSVWTSGNLTAPWTELMHRDGMGWWPKDPSTEFEVRSEGEWETIRIPINPETSRGFLKTGVHFAN